MGATPYSCSKILEQVQGACCSAAKLTVRMNNSIANETPLCAQSTIGSDRVPLCTAQKRATYAAPPAKNHSHLFDDITIRQCLFQLPNSLIGNLGIGKVQLLQTG